MTTQIPTSNTGSAAGLDEATITQLANAFFKALPNDPVAPTPAPIGAPPHPPQLADPRLALVGRVPALAHQQALNPQIPSPLPPNAQEQRPEKYLVSLPVVGAAQLPQLPEPTIPSGIAPEHHGLLDVDRAGSFAHTAQGSGDRAGVSPFYFLDVPKPVATHADLDLAQLQQDPFGLGDVSSFAPAQPRSQQDSGFYFLEGLSTPPAAASVTPTAHAAQQPDHSTARHALNQGGVPNQGGAPLQGRIHQPLHVPTAGFQPLNVAAVRRDFPVLREVVNGYPLAWLDNAATTHKPQSVIDRISYFYQHENSNIHRAAHELAARATDAYEHARRACARFLNARSDSEIVFVRGTTEGINLIAKSWGRQNIGAGDEIIVSNLEHHANIVPWYQLTRAVGAVLKVIPVDDDGQLRLDELRKLITPRTKLISVTQVSNALGTVTPIAEVIDIAHQKGVPVLVDGAQAVSHMPIDVQGLDADFYVFSGHKVFGPTGIGVVYAKQHILDDMPPWQGGGNMIADVRFDQVIYQPAPNKFEAGTGNIADAVGLGAAIEYVERLGMQNIARYEHDLLEYGTHALQQINGLRLIGTAREKASVLSFTLAGYGTEEVGQVLNQHGIAVRTGHHCAQPILRRFGVEATVRPSLAFYNTTEEIDRLVSVLHELRRKRRVS